MINKWKYPTENVMAEYFSLCEQLEKSGKKCNEDLIEEKELQNMMRCSLEKGIVKKSNWTLNRV